MLRKLHYWLIRLVVQETPVIMNVHFLGDFLLAKEHPIKGMLIAGCLFEDSALPSYTIRSSAGGGNDMFPIRYEAEANGVQT